MDAVITLNGRIWIEVNNEKVLGHGRIELLELIHQTGSIRQAALQMKMSYKQAWELTRHINSHFQHPVVISHRGGKGGGNAILTEDGINVIKEFHQLQNRFKDFLKSECIFLKNICLV
ncbi:winged helix-turn-helix domain-containing protein [Mucilaginibacter sp.]